MKAIEQYFPVVLFTMLHRISVTFESVGDHSNESCYVVFPCGAVYYAAQDG